MTPQEERNRRFDEKFPVKKEPSFMMKGWGSDSKKLADDLVKEWNKDQEMFKSHLTSEVNLAIEQVEKWAKDTSAFEIDIPLSDLLSFLTTLKK